MQLDQDYTPNSIRTYTGKVFDLKVLDPESICLEDIAHALAYTPRFGGHLKEFYSVAQHSVLVAHYAPDYLKLQALMHDASEAYIGDMPKPFKDLMPDYCRIEGEIMRAIAMRFRFDLPIAPEVKSIDNNMLSAEWDTFVMGLEVGPMPLEYWTPWRAEAEFLKAFNEYNTSDREMGGY